MTDAAPGNWNQRWETLYKEKCRRLKVLVEQYGDEFSFELPDAKAHQDWYRKEWEKCFLSIPETERRRMYEGDWSEIEERSTP